MSTQTQEVQQTKLDSEIISKLVLDGDISKMNPEQRVEYYTRFCHSLGLNPLTQPFQIIKFQGKEKLYATKDCTEQLRKIHGVSITEITTQKFDDVFVVTAKALDKEGKTDVATGAVNVKGLTGEALANALMRAETKGKRRVTLSICGLGVLDEAELDTMPPHTTAPVTKDVRPVIIRDKDGVVTKRWNDMLRAMEAGKTTIEAVKAACQVPDNFEEMVRHDLTLYNSDEVAFHEVPDNNPESSDSPVIKPDF